jgi:hypothetical protein
MGMLFKLSSMVMVLRHAFVRRRILLVRLFAHYPIGRIIFWISILLKRYSLYFGGWSQRAIEYPWVMNCLSMLPK